MLTDFHYHVSGHPTKSEWEKKPEKNRWNKKDVLVKLWNFHQNSVSVSFVGGAHHPPCSSIHSQFRLWKVAFLHLMLLPPQLVTPWYGWHLQWEDATCMYKYLACILQRVWEKDVQQKEGPGINFLKHENTGNFDEWIPKISQNDGPWKRYLLSNMSILPFCQSALEYQRESWLFQRNWKDI